MNKKKKKKSIYMIFHNGGTTVHLCNVLRIKQIVCIVCKLKVYNCVDRITWSCKSANSKEFKMLLLYFSVKIAVHCCGVFCMYVWVSCTVNIERDCCLNFLTLSRSHLIVQFISFFYTYSKVYTCMCTFAGVKHVMHWYSNVRNLFKSHH